MFAQFRPALVLLLIMTLLTGLAYPLVVTAAAQLLFPRQANGSLIVREDKVLGSELMGQSFSGPTYFWGRPSATSPAYNGAASAGSNLGPTNPQLQQNVRDRVAALKAAHHGQREPVPADLVTASASGLDPHISPAAAEFQVARVATARGLPTESVRAIVHKHTQPRTFGVLGEPRVNVLTLNLELDHAHH